MKSADLDFADGICLIGFQINMTRSVLVRLVSPSSDTDTDLCYGDNEVGWVYAWLPFRTVCSF